MVNMEIQNLPKDNLIKCLSQKISKMNNKKNICTNKKYIKVSLRTCNKNSQKTKIRKTKPKL